jgi:type I restriction-modification system DNA methylase subunit
LKEVVQISKRKKQEALTVGRFISEVLVNQLNIPLRQIVNDTTFSEYTGSKRPDLLISEFEYDQELKNDKQFISNLVAYAEAKDDCKVGDLDWIDAIDQGKKKAPKLGLPYYIVTNVKTSHFYNVKTGAEIKLNGNPLREFQNIDILRIIKSRLKKDPDLDNINTNVDSLSKISEAIFNKKLLELATVYRGINFKNNVEKIDFTIGFVSLEFFEEKTKEEGKKDASQIYWSECYDESSEKLVGNLATYIQRLETNTDFKEFKNLMESVRICITGEAGKPSLIDKDDVKIIYEVVDSMKPLHGAGFDLFGAVYEMFASDKEKKDFGEYFTRRQYTRVFSKLLLGQEKFFNNNKKFRVLDPACGTGGFLTEGFKVLRANYQLTRTFNNDAKKFIEKSCFYGIDVREENISRTKLNMFLVGDGHTNMFAYDTLKHDFRTEKFNYIITNPPYGYGVLKAESTRLSTTRTEIAFLSRIMKLLEIGGKACVITPDGVLENPSYAPFREELLEKCNIDAIVSLPKFAFAPYTKEKTYALFITKRSEELTKHQTEPIWMYIIDNDGLANSDKRFPTRLRNNRNGWMHDEISAWVSTEGEEMPGTLETAWLKFDDSSEGGTTWITDKGIEVTMRKGGFISMNTIESDRYKTLLPEFHLRPYSAKYITMEILDEELKKIREEVSQLGRS